LFNEASGISFTVQYSSLRRAFHWSTRLYAMMMFLCKLVCNAADVPTLI